MALLYVLWACALFVLFAHGFVDASHTLPQSARGPAALAEARAAADGALALGLLAVLDRDPGSVAIGARMLALPGGQAVLSIEDEGGKVDLNRAPPALLEALFRAAGADDPPALVAGVLARRVRMAVLKRPGFALPDELGQVPGVSAALLALAWIDLRTMPLPDALTLPLCDMGLVLALAGHTVPVRDALPGAGIGYATIAGIVHLYRRLRGRDGMGLGDAKLLAASGAWVGRQALPLVLLVAALGTLAVVLLHMRGRAARDTAVPFGPGLAVGIWLAFVQAPLRRRSLGTQAERCSITHHARTGAETATFSGPTTVTNIIGRITGGAASAIDGTVRPTIAGANLFLVNPAGIVMRLTARVAVSGAFHASTADSIRFPDGAKLRVTNPCAGGVRLRRRGRSHHGHWQPDRNRARGLAGGRAGHGGRRHHPRARRHHPHRGHGRCRRGAGRSPRRPRAHGHGLGAATRARQRHAARRGNGAPGHQRAGAGVRPRCRQRGGDPRGDRAWGSVTPDGVRLSAVSVASGMAGPVTIEAGSLTLANGSRVQSVAGADGAAGQVTVTLSGDLSLSGAGLIRADGYGAGAAGRVVVAAGDMALADCWTSRSPGGFRSSQGARAAMPRSAPPRTAAAALAARYGSTPAATC